MCARSRTSKCPCDTILLIWERRTCTCRSAGCRLAPNTTCNCAAIRSVNFSSPARSCASSIRTTGEMQPSPQSAWLIFSPTPLATLRFFVSTGKTPKPAMSLPRWRITRCSPLPPRSRKSACLCLRSFNRSPRLSKPSRLSKKPRAVETCNQPRSSRTMKTWRISTSMGSSTMAQEEERNLKQSFPRELLDQPPSERLSYFKAYTVAHPFLERADEKVRNTLHEPGGALLIFIIGPTGVGKTTLLTFIEQRLLQLAQAQLSHDPDYVPVIKLDAMAPSARQFRWPDFYTRALMAVSEPLIDYKVERGAVLPAFNERMGRHVPPRLVGDAAALQRSWEQVLKYRRPEAILIDEAHHFAKTAGGNRLEDQLDHVKSLAIATKTIHILAGTYDLLLFRNLNAELSRPNIDVHFPRYDATNPEERKAFHRQLLTLQRHR